MSSSISRAAQLNAALMARPEDERDALFTALADRHAPGIYQSFGKAALEKGGGGLKPIEHSPDGDASKTKYPVNYTGFTTSVVDDYTLKLTVAARVETRSFPHYLPGATGNFFHGTVPIMLTEPVIRGVANALGINLMPLVADAVPPPLRAISPALNDAILDSIEANGRSRHGNVVSAVSDDAGNRYVSQEFANYARDSVWLGHPSDPTGQNDGLPEPAPNRFFATLHQFTGFGSRQQRCHVFELRPDGKLEHLGERIFNLGFNQTR